MGPFTASILGIVICVKRFWNIQEHVIKNCTNNVVGFKDASPVIISSFRKKKLENERFHKILVKSSN